MQESVSKPRVYKYRNVDFKLITQHYRLPLAGRLSILHRVSGVLLFLSLPTVLIPVFDFTVNNPHAFSIISQHLLLKVFLEVVLFGLLWAFFHHLCAGIRFLTLDLHVGLSKQASRRSALISFLVSFSLTAAAALKIMLGVF